MKYDKLQKPKFSPRMKALVSHCIPTSDLWDFCCDHGFIGLYAFTVGDFKDIHFVDKQDHIIDRLIKLLNKAEIPLSTLYFHKSDARKLDQTVRGNLILAGVGGSLGVKILESLFQRGLLQANRIIFSPHTQEEDSLNGLLNLEGFPYSLLKTDSILEGSRNRQIFILDRNM